VRLPQQAAVSGDCLCKTAPLAGRRSAATVQKKGGPSVERNKARRPRPGRQFARYIFWSLSLSFAPLSEPPSEPFKLQPLCPKHLSLLRAQRSHLPLRPGLVLSLRRKQGGVTPVSGCPNLLPAAFLGVDAGNMGPDYVSRAPLNVRTQAHRPIIPAMPLPGPRGSDGWDGIPAS
jgi:hypothetical protein